MNDKPAETVESAAEPAQTAESPEAMQIAKATSEKRLTPLHMLAISLAYMIDADKVREAEERAELVVVFNKMVTRGELNKQGLAGVINAAFDYVKDNDLEDFLKIAAEKLTPLQKASVYINALDLMLSDGQVVGGESHVLKRFQDAFNIEREVVLAIREVLFAKNDTRMFLYPEHPRNARDAFLRIYYRAAATNE